MVRFTQSFSHWLFENHKDIYALVLLGHTELVTEEMWNKYIEWCNTDDMTPILMKGKDYEKRILSLFEIRVR